MRIRKNAKNSSVLFSHGASGAEEQLLLQTHVCQLNQSPWDVIPFSHQDSLVLHQFEGEDSFNGNGSLGDSIGAVESVASMMEDAEDGARVIKMKVDSMVFDDNYKIRGNPDSNSNNKKRLLDDYEEMKPGSEIKTRNGDRLIQLCNKNDGKGWHCKNETKEGHSMCSHHLALLKSNTNSEMNAIKKPDKQGPRRGGRGRPAKKGTSSAANPYEFYYYSGFGPLWGKRRGDRAGDINNNNNNGVNDEDLIKEDENASSIIALSNTSPSPTPSPPRIERNYNSVDGFDFVEDEDEDDDEVAACGGDGGKKRMRKPVKARSLKSLM